MSETGISIIENVPEPRPPLRPGKHRQARPHHAAGHRQGRIARSLWINVFTLLVLAPLAVSQTAIHEDDGILRASIVTGMLATSLFVVTAMITARMRSTIGAFGITGLMTAHRYVGLSLVVLVISHVELVLFGDHRHLSILNLPTQPRQVWAGTIAVAALLALVGTALTQHRRRPRYEGWRLWHVGLALIAVVGTALHVLWLELLRPPSAMRWVYAAMLLVIVAVLIRRWLWTPWRQYERGYVVDNIERLPGDVVNLTVAAKGHHGFHFMPGQFAWMKIGDSPFVFEDHPFSMSSTSTTPALKQFMIKALGDYTELIAALRPGRRVWLDGPYGRFTLEKVGKSAGLVMVAAGTGIAPIMSMLRTLSANGYDHPIVLMTPLPPADIDKLELELNLRLVTVDNPFDVRPHLPAQGMYWHDYYVCGPPLLVASVTRQLRDQSILPNRIHTEHFS